MASNTTDGHGLFANEATYVPNADIIVQALCTAPFVDSRIIDDAISVLLDSDNYDSVIAVRQEKLYRWNDGAPEYGLGKIPNSIDLPSQIIEAMSLYIVRRKSGAKLKMRFGEKPYFQVLDPRESIDVNNETDLLLAELVCAGERANLITHFQSLRTLFSSSLLSDICKGIGLKSMLPSSIMPVSNGRVLGFAKTLKLKSLENNSEPRISDSWRGIFDALDTYKFIRPGDVIMVSNDVPDKAYFGDLNATLAIRHGAIGAVIDGATRDVERVREMYFPVYAQRAHGDDIRYEGTVENMNQPIKIGDIIICNNDIVFADADGVCVIPRKHWENVERLALDTVEREAK